MSMNLSIDILGTTVELYQTPTDLTNRIMAAPTVARQVELYSDWCRNQLAVEDWKEHLQTVRNAMNLAGAKFVRG